MILIPFSGTAEANLNYDVVVFVDSEQVDFPDQKPYIDDAVSRTYVPIRFVSEALGATVDWDSVSQTVYIKDTQYDVSLTVGSGNYYVNSATKTLDAPPVIVGGRTMVPLRFVSEALDRKVDYTPWGAFGRVDIYDPGKKPVIPEPKPNVVQFMDQALGGDYMQPERVGGDWVYERDNVFYRYEPPKPDHYGVIGSDFIRIHYDEQKAGSNNKVIIREIAQRFLPDKIDDAMESFDVAIGQFHKITANKPEIPHILSETGSRWFIKAHSDPTGDFVSIGIKLVDSK